MDILINIDGGLYEWVHRQLGDDEGWQLVQDAIMSGKVLPKGHGKIGDLDKLKKKRWSISMIAQKQVSIQD